MICFNNYEVKVMNNSFFLSYYSGTYVYSWPLAGRFSYKFFCDLGIMHICHLFYQGKKTDSKENSVKEKTKNKKVSVIVFNSTIHTLIRMTSECWHK